MIGEFAKFKATIGYMEMGGDDQDKDGKYSFDEFKTVLESHREMNDIFLKIADAKDDSNSQTTKIFGRTELSLYYM